MVGAGVVVLMDLIRTHPCLVRVGGWKVCCSDCRSPSIVVLSSPPSIVVVVVAKPPPTRNYYNLLEPPSATL